MHVRTRYFFAGGSARCPWVKEDEYFSDEASTFFWMADMVTLRFPFSLGQVCNESLSIWTTRITTVYSVIDRSNFLKECE